MAIFLCMYLQEWKKCSNFAVESYVEGNMSGEKRFVKGLSLGRFLTYWIAFIDALHLTNRKLRNFSITLQIKVTVNAYGYDYIQYYISLGCSVFSYQRRFPVVYWSVKVMRRPRFVNKQLEVCAFLLYIYTNQRYEKSIIFYNVLLVYMLC